MIKHKNQRNFSKENLKNRLNKNLTGIKLNLKLTVGKKINRQDIMRILRWIFQMNDIVSPKKKLRVNPLAFKKLLLLNQR